MPDGFVPDDGLGDELEYLIRREIVGVLPWELVLWVNDYTPDETTVWGDLVEASFPGYHRVSMDRSTWTTPVVMDGCARSTLGTDPVEWIVSGTPNETVYGLAYWDQSTGRLRFVQRFDDGDVVTTAPGKKLKLLPEFTLRSAACGALLRARTRIPAAVRRRGGR